MDKEKTTKFAYQHLEELGYSREMVSSKKTLNGEDIDLVVNFREKPIIAVKIITGSFDDYRAFNRISILFFLSTTPYLILINKEKQVVWLETKVGLVLQADNPVNFSRVLPNIQTIHEEIFNFLYQQHQDFQEQREKLKLKFKLRQKNTRSRLQKGYWFPGNDNHLTISFWQGRDSLNKTPYIYFNIDRDGSMTLYFVAKTSETLKMFYASQLAKVLNLKPDKRDKNNQVTVWSKEYYSHWQGDYLKVLEDFIYRERIIIDNFIFILLGIGLSVLLAAMSYKLLEGPSQRLLRGRKPS